MLSFETDTAEAGHLGVRWLLRDIASGQTIAEKEADLTATAAGNSSERPVASLSKVLGDFSVGIAGAIRELTRNRLAAP